MFLHLEKNERVADVMSAYPFAQKIILCKQVQSGKTAEMLELAEKYFSETSIVVITDRNLSLQGQTDNRAKKLGWTVHNYDAKENLGAVIARARGKRVMVSVLMEKYALEQLERVFLIDDENRLKVTLFVDEADKCRSTIDTRKKNKKGAKEEEEQEEDTCDSETSSENVEADGNKLPPITQSLLRIANHVCNRVNSRTFMISATPLSVLTAEKADWLFIYKESFLNHVGPGLNKEAKVSIQEILDKNTCPATIRWDGSIQDRSQNSFRPAVRHAVRCFIKAPNRALPETEICQLMLISLENRKRPQHDLGFEIQHVIVPQMAQELGIENPKIGIIVLNSDTKESSDITLADMIAEKRKEGFLKIVVIAGFMAARGVSFTDFSDKENQFELMIQVHYTKATTNLGSALQAMRWCGPARRTVNTVGFITNSRGKRDVEVNFLEYYRICKEVAETGHATMGDIDPFVAPVDPASLWYMVKTNVSGKDWNTGLGRFLVPHPDPLRHLPIKSGEEE